ncbi:MAG: spermidine/putrescine transport system permease protein [Gaiellales bacterium]|jgi:spermidine/putrescine transport system permease protein|nr:spermidine/putrescine transport system permease protein [Gaiellales bacterium]
MGRLARGLMHGYFLVLVVFLYAPLVVLVIFAFNDSTVPTLPLSGFTTRWFHQAFSNTDLTGSARRSLELAAMDGVLATVLGVMAAAGLAARRVFLRSVITTVLLLPLVVPYIVLAVGLVILLHQLGITTSLTAVLAGHIVISLPYSVLVILPRLRLLDASINEAARDLGASELWAFVLVTLPLLAPALASSFLIAFTISFDEFAIASFLAPAGAPTFPVFVYTGARTPLLQPEVIAVGSIVVVASLVLVIGAELVRRFWEGRLEGRKGETAPAFAVGA